MRGAEHQAQVAGQGTGTPPDARLALQRVLMASGVMTSFVSLASSPACVAAFFLARRSSVSLQPLPSLSHPDDHLIGIVDVLWRKEARKQIQ